MRRGMRSLSAVIWLLAISPGVHAAESLVCPVTGPPEPAFIPPAPFRPYSASRSAFLFGTDGLWTLVTPQWTAVTGNKLPYFAAGFDWKRESRPRLTVVARRLDKPYPLVSGNWVNAADPGNGEGSFMVTSLPQLQPGCWEITARYVPSQNNEQTLSYVVQVQ